MINVSHQISSLLHLRGKGGSSSLYPTHPAYVVEVMVGDEDLVFQTLLALVLPVTPAEVKLSQGLTAVSAEDWHVLHQLVQSGKRLHSG